MNYFFRSSRVLSFSLAVAATASFAMIAANSQAQSDKGTKGKGLPPNYPFGYEPGKKVIPEGVFRVDGAPKGKMEVLTQMVESVEKSVVVYTRQSDDAILKLAAALEAKGDGLKDCPTHFVFLVADRKKLEEKTAGHKKISLLQSNRTDPPQVFKLDPKVTTMVFLVERGTIKTKFEVMEDKLDGARIDELTKAILAYAAPAPPSPLAPLNIKDRLVGHPGGARTMVFSPDGKWLYSHGTHQDNGLDARISKWELATGKQLANVASHGGSASGLQLTRDGKTLLSIGHNTEVKFWDAADLKLIDTIKLPLTPFSLRLSPDQNTFAVGGGLFRDNTIRIFDLSSKKEKFVLNGHADRVRAVDYSPESKLIVSGDESGQIKLWNAVEGKEIATWPASESSVECIAFSPDGKWVASGARKLRSNIGRAQLWDVETGKEVRELESTGVFGVNAIAFLNGGKKLALAHESNNIRFIDLETGKQAGELSGHGSAVISLVLSPDGATLASGEWHATIRLWNVKEKK